MDCPHLPIQGLGAFSRRMHDSVIKGRIPVSGSIELTWRCNLRCRHCYLDSVHDASPVRPELSTDEVKGIFDQVVDAGTLWMLITGGEPLLRRDFSAIYTHAKRKGLLVNLFTNGTLITERVADLLAEYPPFTVEISLYGFSQTTYERVTGIPGSHARCMAGIERLVERKIPLCIKTVVMTLNQHELNEIREFALRLGARFRYDPLLHPGVDNNPTPATLRIDPETAIEMDIADSQRTKSWTQFRQIYENRSVDVRTLFVCEAGLSTYHVDPYGQMSMCMLVREPAFDLRHGSFHEGWQQFLAEIRNQPAPEGKCNECSLLAMCNQCPGWSQLEGTSPRQPLTYLCEITHRQAQAIGFVGQIPCSTSSHYPTGT